MDYDEDEAMAAQMGFSSFGQKPQAKKRKIEEHRPELPTNTTTQQQTSHDSGPQIPENAVELSQQDNMRALRRGVRNQRGDMVYFMPSFIEDPWAKLRGSSTQDS